MLRTVALIQSAMTASFLTPKTNKRSNLFNRKSILVVRETVRTHDFMVENVQFYTYQPTANKGFSAQALPADTRLHMPPISTANFTCTSSVSLIIHEVSRDSDISF